MDPASAAMVAEINRRRTFAIISHPDAGKTTLTEKLLLYAGAILSAGMVKGRKGGRRAVSDWMAMEQERGISVTSSAISFPCDGCMMNLLDTPGHQDFCEDTYRTLTAVDGAIMVLDAGKGVEAQTLKLFEVCRLRQIPVITLINKMDMPGRDPLELIHEVEQALGIQAYVRTWPIGSGKGFIGVVDRQDFSALFFEKVSLAGARRALSTHVPCNDLSALGEHLDKASIAQLQEELDLLAGAGHPWNLESFLRGQLTPVFFASAMNNFGIEPFFTSLTSLFPPPGPRVLYHQCKPTHLGPYEPFAGYVFKLQANMDRNHRDSVAFIRVCSGELHKDMSVYHHRLKRTLRLSRPQGMSAGERNTLEVAYAGDVVGVINPGLFTLGDTLSLLPGIGEFPPLPQFHLEVFAQFMPRDVSKRKAFDKGLEQLLEEGLVQLLTTSEGSRIFGAVGSLQLDVVEYRLTHEYGAAVTRENLPYSCSSWVQGQLDPQLADHCQPAYDQAGHLLLLFSSQWEKNYTINHYPQLTFSDVRTSLN